MPSLSQLCYENGANSLRVILKLLSQICGYVNGICSFWTISMLTLRQFLIALFFYRATKAKRGCAYVQTH